MTEYWQIVPRPSQPGAKSAVDAAIERGAVLADKLVIQRDALFPPMRKVLQSGGPDALAISVLGTLVEVLADFTSRRGRQHRPELPLYHPLWEVMLIGGADGVVACAFGVQVAVLGEHERGAA